jgi:subtilisin
MDCWINLDEARRALQDGDGSGVTVAIIDSGIEVSHPQLNGIQLVDDLAVVPFEHTVGVVSGNGVDVFGHGTAVAGVVLSLAPRCRVGSIRVLGSDNSSKTEIVQRAAQEALDRGYKIINCSFGCALKAQILRYKAWVDEAYLKGVHVIAACNNQDFRTPEWPAYFPSVVAVNMVRTDEESQFYYQKGTLVEFAARGMDVKVLWSRGGEKIVSGSSFAAPRLAAMLARLLSVYPDITPIQAKAMLHKIAQPWENGAGKGIRESA